MCTCRTTTPRWYGMPLVTLGAAAGGAGLMPCSTLVRPLIKVTRLHRAALAGPAAGLRGAGAGPGGNCFFLPVSGTGVQALGESPWRPWSTSGLQPGQHHHQAWGAPGR